MDAYTFSSTIEISRRNEVHKFLLEAMQIIPSCDVH